MVTWFKFLNSSPDYPGLPKAIDAGIESLSYIELLMVPGVFLDIGLLEDKSP